METIIVCFVIFCLNHVSSLENVTCIDTENEEFCVLEGYNPNKIPPVDLPLNVFIDLKVDEIIEVDDMKKSFTTRLAFQVSWTDPRIIRLKNDTYDINMGISAIHEYFIPDLYTYDLIEFEQLKFQSEIITVMLRNKEQNIRLYFEGLLTSSCKMNFDKYPFESHKCDIYFGSIGFTDLFMHFEGKLTYNENLQQPLQYNIGVSHLSSDKLTYMGQNGNWSMTGFEINLERKTGRMLLQIYMPSAMFVMVSWISFLIPHESPARTGLNVTLFLVLVSMFLAVISHSPTAKHLTAVETWMIVCLMFVFLALMQYGMVLRIKVIKKVSKIAKSKPSIKEEKNEQMNATVKINNRWVVKEQANKETAEAKLDKFAMIVMPSLFIIFNIVYWIYYAS